MQRKWHRTDDESNEWQLSAKKNYYILDANNSGSVTNTIKGNGFLIKFFQYQIFKQIKRNIAVKAFNRE